MRLIDADKVIINIANIITMGDMFEAGVAHGIHKAVNELLDAPNIEAEPVRYGRWNIRTFDLPREGYYCSECGTVEWRTSRFCPYCGAKMEGKNEDGVD